MKCLIIASMTNNCSDQLPAFLHESPDCDCKHTMIRMKAQVSCYLCREREFVEYKSMVIIVLKNNKDSNPYYTLCSGPLDQT